MDDDHLPTLADLTDERNRLESMLDEAMGRYALAEEDINGRMKNCPTSELQALLDERTRIEDALGITAILERLDQLRLCMGAASAAE